MDSQAHSQLPPCPLCGRPLIPGPSVNEHHLVPKSKKGRETLTLHRICHSKIHSIFTEQELERHYHTVERLRDHVEIQKFIQWVRKKDPEFMDRNKSSQRLRDKRGKKR